MRKLFWVTKLASHLPVMAEAGQPFAGDGRGCHHGGYLQRVPVSEDYPEVYQHSYAYQEERDEQGVADELYVVLQRGDVGYESVEQYAGEECSEYAFKSGYLHQSG